MNLKSYLRGIGAGMILAALIMGIALQRPLAESKEDPKQTLLESATSVSASVEENNDKNNTSVSAESSEKNDAADVENKTDNTASASSADELNGDTKDDTQNEAGNTEADSNPDKAPSDNGSENTDSQNNDSLNTEETEKTPTPINPLEKGDTGFTEDEESVSIKIVRGDSSVTVARRLYEAGLVDSAVNYNKYLCKNGYDKSIKVGTFTIKKGSDYETIAKIISKKK